MSPSPRILRHASRFTLLALLALVLAACDTGAGAPPPVPLATNPALWTPTPAPLPPGVSTAGALPAAVSTAADLPTGVRTPDAPTFDAAANEPPRISKEAVLDLMQHHPDQILVIDVRQKVFYDEEHIKGAISFPMETIDARVSELPKDKLIVAYCQWPAENESASSALQLHTKYHFSYDHLQVLLGGIHGWEDAHYPLEGTDVKGAPVPSVMPTVQ
jgi:rhodanese-related sulfurtransferase